MLTKEANSMFTQYKRLLVTLDGSELADQIISHACQMAAAFGAELILFRVVREVQPEPDYAILTNRFMNVSYPYSSTEALGEVNQRHLIKEAEQALGRLSLTLEYENIKSEVVVKIGDDPAEKIIDYAATHNIDMILMSTHGRTGLAHLVYGSVAEAVLHKAPCPVFLLRSVIE
jgi:nucleotide-binding universal stress UspA family protein